MTSKKALERIILGTNVDTYRSSIEEIDEAISLIEKDLEVLEKYKSIEEELGIDLITLFKALKNGFYHIDEKKHIYTLKPTKGNCGAMSYYASYYEIIAEDVFDDQYIYNLKDYGKVWALTKEELKANRR